MPRFNEDQKKIALLLLNEPKTEEDMNKQLNIPYDKLTQELKALLKLGVITKEGYPTKYRLKQEIVDKIQQRKEISEQDSFKMRLNAIIEFKAIEAELLKKHMKEITAALKKEKAFTIYDVREAEIIEDDDDMESSFLEVNLSVMDFRALIKFLFYYGPTSIEVLKPNKIELSNFEFQDGLMELAEIFQKYANFFTKHLNQEELTKFYKSAYK
ncbi:MAG: hypothetical protein HOE11_04050 [Candidatus Diapherotrites archaeon]|jgi:hypothetical protein|nr:hypothetical protein [Candidatus Diapherotrites archaeon]MBT4597352.1 hypothetical protein [Candidatus Diapherotrites archaeon]